MNGIVGEQIPAPSWCTCHGQQICEQHLALGVTNEAASEDGSYALWLRSDDAIKLRPDQLLAFQERLNQRVLAIAACIREGFTEGLDEGTSMHIARRVAALPGESAPPFEDRVDTVWSLLIEAGDEGSRYTAEKIVEALS